MFGSLRISHVEFRFPGSEKLGPRRNGQMEGIFRLFRFSGILGQPRDFGMKFRKMSVPFNSQPGISGIFGRMKSAQRQRDRATSFPESFLYF